jgi:hypothetical protein
VSGLAELGAVEQVADLAAPGLALGLELADDLPREGRFGTGVLVAPLGSAIAVGLDVVFVVGLAEELVPGRLREDALRPERVRALAPGQLAPWRDRLDRQHRQLLAALAAAPERIVSFPRGDLRRSSTRLPSRWLLPSLRALSGLQATRWESVSGRCAGPVLALCQAWQDRQRRHQATLIDVHRQQNRTREFGSVWEAGRRPVTCPRAGGSRHIGERPVRDDVSLGI